MRVRGLIFDSLTRAWKFFFALACFVCLQGALNAQIQFEQIGNIELIPHNVVTDLVQDHDGYLWIATVAGVVRHDGYRFKLFDNDPEDDTSLGGNFVRDINVFDDGTLWFSTEPGGVSIYDPSTEEFTRLFTAQTLAEHPNLFRVSQVILGGDELLWLATNSGVYRSTRQGDVHRHYTTDDGLPHNGIMVLLRDSKDNIWVGTRSGLARYSNSKDRFVPVLPERRLSNDLYIRVLFEAMDGSIWVGTDASGIWLYEPQSDRLRPTLQKQPQQLQRSTVYDIFQLNETEIWAARFGGIDRIDAQQARWLSRTTHDPSDNFSLANNDIRTLLKDRSDVLWIGGYGSGVQRMMNNMHWLKSQRFSLLSDNALTEPNVSSVLELSNGSIWVGTRGGGINILDLKKGIVGGHFPQTGVEGQLQAGWVTAMAEMPSGEVWVGVNPRQLYRFNPLDGDFHLYTQQQGLPHSNIRVLRTSVRGGLWIGTSSGLLYWDNKTDSFVSYKLRNEQPMGESINALHEDKEGQLLVATGSNGLFKVDADSNHIDTIKGQNEYGDPLNTLGILGMLMDSKQRLWLDTPGGLHLAIFDEEGKVRLENRSQQAGFGGRPMGANILEDKQGRIWSPSFIYNPQTQVMTPLQRADGVDIGTSWFRSYNKTKSGKFLFGGSRGLLIVNPDDFSFWNYEPPMVASELRVDGSHVSAGKLTQEGLRLSPQQRSFSIEFAALDLSAPEKNRYRYQLEGFDEQWVEVDATRRIASYSNLWPGEYTFRAEGTNRAGQWSKQQLTFDVVIEAAYWQTLWFVVLCIVLVLTLVYQGFRLRTRWMQARSRVLEELVERRSQELKKAQKDFIEQEKMASLGGLVAGVSHEINTPMGIALTAATSMEDECRLVSGKLEENQLKRSELQKYLDKADSSLKIILGSLERACELIVSFKQVAVDQTSEQRRQFDMNTLLQDIERALHSLYATEGHQLDIDCPRDIKLDSYPGAVFQVFTNLINNSIVHGFSDEKQGKITIKVTEAENKIIIRYCDDGIGMTTEVQEKAFEPFFTTKLGVGGSGLGLHLVYNYISQVLGGKITIDAYAAKGFACFIEVPLTAPSKD